MKILVIEDDVAISELICMNLETAGYETLPIFDGSEAALCLQNRDNSDIALALVDVMLPGKDCFALIEDLMQARIPVIYLTAKDDALSKVHGLKAGEVYYVNNSADESLLTINAMDGTVINRWDAHQ